MKEHDPETCCGLPRDDDGRCVHRPHHPIAVKVIETPAEKLRRVAGLEGAPREVLWEAIASAVIDINERMTVLEADADARRRVVAAIQQRVGLPQDVVTPSVVPDDPDPNSDAPKWPGV